MKKVIISLIDVAAFLINIILSILYLKILFLSHPVSMTGSDGAKMMGFIFLVIIAVQALLFLITQFIYTITSSFKLKNKIVIYCLFGFWDLLIVYFYYKPLAECPQLIIITNALIVIISKILIIWLYSLVMKKVI